MYLHGHVQTPDIRALHHDRESAHRVRKRKVHSHHPLAAEAVRQIGKIFPGNEAQRLGAAAAQLHDHHLAIALTPIAGKEADQVAK